MITWDDRSFRAGLRAFADKFPDRVLRALREEAEIEATEAKRRTPVDTGNLRASIHVEPPVRDGRQLYVTIVAGGIPASYAIPVHEDLEAFHRVGEAKFLERPLLEAAPHIPARIAARLRFGF